MAINIGPKIGIDGEAEYRAQLKGVIQQTKTLASEMQKVTSSFDKSTSAEKKSAAQKEVLNKQIQAQEKLVAQMAKAVNEAAAKYGEADITTQKWTQQMNKAETELNKMKNQLKNIDQGLDEVDDGFEESGNSAASFGDILKANVLSQAIVDGFNRLVDLSKELVSNMIENAASIKAETSQFKQTFGEFEKEAKTAIENVANSSGILETRLNTLGSSIYAFARSSGGSTAESMEIMEKALQAAADGAAYYDRSLEETSESLMSFLKGNYANDAALGLSATETTRNAEAMEQFGKKFNDLTEIEKQKTLLQMVLDAQELSGAMGQASREADGWENVQGNLNEAWRQFTANAGIPLLEHLTPLIQDVTKKITEMTQTTDWEQFGENVSNFINSIVENGPLILSIISGIGVAFVAWNVSSMINGLVTSIQAFKTANEGATIAQMLMNKVMSANPIGIVVTLIAGLVTAIMTLWATNEDFRNAVIEIFTNIGNKAKEIVDNIVNFFTVTIPEGIEYLKTAFQNMKEKISTTVGNIYKSIVDGIGKAVDWIKSLPSQAVNWGKDMIQGFINGIKSMIGGVVDAVSGIANTIAGWLHFSRPDVGPLREYEKWMPDFVGGMAKSLRNSEWMIESAISNIASGMVIDVGSPSVASLNTPSSGFSGSINVNVYAAEGQDERLIADRVAEIIDQKIQTKRGAFA